jgi:hypothetical protein
MKIIDNFKYKTINLVYIMKIVPLIIVFFLILLITPIYSIAESNLIIFNEKTPNAELYNHNGERYWTVTIEPQNGAITVKIPPNIHLIASSNEPTTTNRLVKKYLWGALVTYEGTILTYKSETSVDFTYRYATNSDKFNSFFSII